MRATDATIFSTPAKYLPSYSDEFDADEYLERQEHADRERDRRRNRRFVSSHKRVELS